MKIEKLEAWSVRMTLREPYTIAYETISETTNVFLRITTDTGLSGFGCGAPDLEVTGETPETVLSHFRETAEPLLKGQFPFRIAWFINTLRRQCPGNPSLLCMVDTALHDLLAKQAGLPLFQLLGGFRKSIPTSITIGILDVEKTLQQALEFRSQGFFVFKIKGGRHVEEDVARMFRLREELGPEVRLRFDGNQGYSVEDTIRFVEATRNCRLEIIEQPTAKNELEKLGQVTRQTHLPIMADESLVTLKDAFRLARNDWADMINIKLTKVGGIYVANHINSVAKAAGMEAMVGCMDESALGISAGLHFTLSRPNVEYADLDGHLDLLEDPFSDCFRLKNGVLYPLEKPGLGARLK